jgi:hypothetical protein
MMKERTRVAVDALLVVATADEPPANLADQQDIVFAELEALAQDATDADFWEKEAPAWSDDSWGFDARRLVNGQLTKDSAATALALIFQRSDMTRAELEELISTFPSKHDRDRLRGVLIDA